MTYNKLKLIFLQDNCFLINLIWYHNNRFKRPKFKIMILSHMWSLILIGFTLLIHVLLAHPNLAKMEVKFRF
jgi:hypothetical protein